MCLAVPAQIECITDGSSVVALMGSRTNVSLALVPSAKVGDWVLVHAGFAITILDADQARQTYQLLSEAFQRAKMPERPAV